MGRKGMRVWLRELILRMAGVVLMLFGIREMVKSKCGCRAED